MSEGKPKKTAPADKPGRPDFYSDEQIIGSLKHTRTLLNTSSAVIANGDVDRMLRYAVLMLEGRHVDKTFKNWLNSKKPRRKVNKSDLVGFRAEYVLENGKMRGWIPAALKRFNIDRDTLNKECRNSDR